MNPDKSIRTFPQHLMWPISFLPPGLLQVAVKVPVHVARERFILVGVPKEKYLADAKAGWLQTGTCWTSNDLYWIYVFLSWSFLLLIDLIGFLDLFGTIFTKIAFKTMPTVGAPKAFASVESTFSPGFSPGDVVELRGAELGHGNSVGGDWISILLPLIGGENEWKSKRPKFVGFQLMKTILTYNDTHTHV